MNPSVAALAEKNWDGAHVTALMERTIVHARLLTVGVLDGLAVGERRFRRDGTFLAARLPKTADQEALAAAVATPPTVAECAYDADIATAPWDLTTRVGVTL